MRRFLKATREGVYIPSLNGFASTEGENIEVNGFVERLIKSGDLVSAENGASDESGESLNNKKKVKK